MWKRSEIRADVTYALELCEDNSGIRTVRLVSVDNISESSGCVFRTKPVPRKLLLSRDLQTISKSVSLADGENFYVDAHGVWFSKAEFDALFSMSGEARSVPWIRGKAPKLAPK